MNNEELISDIQSKIDELKKDILRKEEIVTELEEQISINNKDEIEYMNPVSWT